MFPSLVIIALLELEKVGCQHLLYKYRKINQFRYQRNPLFRHPFRVKRLHVQIKPCVRRERTMNELNRFQPQNSSTAR